MPVAAPTRKGPDVETSPIAWKTVSGIKSGDRPLVLWIADPILDLPVEHRAFDDTDVRLASHAFRLARISPAVAKLDPILEAYARSGPALLVFAPDLSRATILYGSTLDARTVLEASRGFASTYLRLDLDASVLRARTLLAEQRTLTDERTTLAGAASSEAEATRRQARVTAIDARILAIGTEVEGLFHARA